MNRFAAVGGILSIVSGSLGILSGLVIIVMAFFVAWLFTIDPYAYGNSEISGEVFGTFLGLFYGVMGAVWLLLGILALIGGIFGLKKKVWGLALAGSISAVMVFFPVGVVAVVFTAMAKAEFDGHTTAAPVSPPPPAAQV